MSPYAHPLRAPATASDLGKRIPSSFRRPPGPGSWTFGGFTCTPHAHRAKQMRRAALVDIPLLHETGKVCPDVPRNSRPSHAPPGRTTTLTRLDPHRRTLSFPHGERSFDNTSRSPMRTLNHELKQLCHRNRDGSFGTQADRLHILDLIADQLHEAGYRNLHATGLKPKHVEALTKRWVAESLNPGTIKNRMAQLRWWAEKIGRRNVVARDNATYGIENRTLVSGDDKSRTLTPTDLSRITDPYTAMSLRLQAAFGLRRAESIKIPTRLGRSRGSPRTQADLVQGRTRTRDPDSHRRAAAAAQRSEGLRRQRQSHSGRQEVRRAAASVRASVPARRHPSGARASARVCAGALSGTDWMEGTLGRWPELEGAYRRAARGRPRSAGSPSAESSVMSVRP